MRWKTNKGLKSGDIQHVKYFAFFPIALSDGYTVWLETYWAEEKWQVCFETTSGYGWCTIRTWCEKKARPNET